MKGSLEIITEAWLRDHNTVSWLVDRIRQEWPDGIKVNEEDLVQAALRGLDLTWFGSQWLPRHMRRKFQGLVAPLDAEYQRQARLVEAEYQRQEAPIRAEYNRLRTPFEAEYRLLVGPIVEEYKKYMLFLHAKHREDQRDIATAVFRRLVGPLEAEYDRQVAPIWAEYDRREAPLKAERLRQRTSLQETYDRQVAHLILELSKQR